LIELLLENPIELKTEEDLRAKKQKPVFIQRSFDFFVELHLVDRNVASDPARRRLWPNFSSLVRV
jgi:hypothetical protein